MTRENISAIIVAYKSDNYINECIKSLETSSLYSGIPLEIIIVINDRKNNRYKLPSKYNVIRTDKNFGYAKGLNEGVKKASGQWLLILNPDTITDRKVFKIFSQHFSKKRVRMIIPSIYFKNSSFQLNINTEPTLWHIFLEQSYLYKLFPNIFKYSLLNKKILIKMQYIKTAEGTYMCIKYSAFKEIGGFDERFFMYFEDIDLSKRLVGKGYKIIFDPEARVTHFNHQSSRGIMIGEYYIDSLRKFLLKYHSKYYANIGLLLVIIGCYLRYIYWNIVIRISHNHSRINFGKNKIMFCEKILRNISFS